MRIKSFYIRNFRNISEETFFFDDNVNIFFGNNAQGKTNLLEALSVCIGKGFRGAKTSSLIPFEANSDCSQQSENVKIQMRLVFTSDIFPDKENVIEYQTAKGKTSVTLNKIPMKSAAELYGVLKYVVFIPEHLSIIKGVPEQRRDYLDNVAVMQTKTHSQKLVNYNKALRQKNNLLFKCANSRMLDGDKTDRAERLEAVKAQMLAWNSALAMEGINVTYGRLKYFDFLSDYAAELYSQLAGKNEKLTMEYKSSVFDISSEKPDFVHKDKIYEQYLEALENAFDEDLKNGFTTKGVHRDDVVFYINGHNAREFGSQGQLRSIALVLKLAEAEIIRQRHSESPIILLDEVFSELDAERRSFVAQHIVDSQIFITTCNIGDIMKVSEKIAENHIPKMWEVSGGRFEESGEQKQQKK